MTTTPTRAALLDAKEEQRAMREGHVFLDEKCLLLAGEMLRQLQLHAQADAKFNRANEVAMQALHAAVARHGLHGLQTLPPASIQEARLDIAHDALMGVHLQRAQWHAGAITAPASIEDAPETHALRRAFAALAEAAAPLAALNGNLERLAVEYRRSVRRARALQDVLLPALERDIAGIETQLEELEQQDAVAMRRRIA